MPTYDYQCRSCGSVTEVIHSMLEEGPAACERCGGTLRRVLYPTGIIFKGSGFYRTDSRDGRGTSGTAEGTKGGTDAGKDAGKGSTTAASATSETSKPSETSTSKTGEPSAS